MHLKPLAGGAVCISVTWHYAALCVCLLLVYLLSLKVVTILESNRVGAFYARSENGVVFLHLDASALQF